MTSKTFTATAAGRILADLISSVGTVNVTVDPALHYAEVTVSTGATEGPLADAVRNATSSERTVNHQNVLEVRVPKVQGATFGVGGTTTLMAGGSTFTFTGGSSVSMVGGDIYVGGHRVVQNGRVVAEQGTIVGGAGGFGTIQVDVRLPAFSSVRLETTSADLTARGDLQLLDVDAVSGDVHAEGIHTLRTSLTSGDVQVERIDARADLRSISGDIHIGAYSGSSLRAEATSGDVHISATPQATGEFSVRTISGDVTTRGAAHLSPRVRTNSGDKYVR